MVQKTKHKKKHKNDTGERKGETMDWETIICTIIANAGESKSDSLAAIEAAAEERFDEAAVLMKKSEKAYLAAHEAHMQILTKEGEGEPVPMTFLLIHAANHLSNAEITKDMAEQLVKILRKGIKTC